VGESGGGKSSITNLIEHLYEQSEGEVLLDGIPVHELAPSWLSKNVSIVSQTPTLFGRSIRRNIMYVYAQPDFREIHTFRFLHPW
jgi:ABC-type multidrug transport system fused ATPase/permease subunit